MKLSNVISKLEDVDEKFRELYEKGVDSEGAECFNLQTDENTGLKTALDRERLKGASAKKKLAAFEEAGITIQKYEETLTKVDVLETEISDVAAGKKTDIETIRQQVRNEVAEQTRKEIETHKDRSAVLTGALEKRVIRDEARAAIVAAKGNADLLMPHVANSLQMKEIADGSFAAVVIDEAGEERVGDAYGNPMTIGQFVEEMREKDAFLTAFEAMDKKGANLTPGGGGKGKDYSEIKDPAQRLRTYRQDQAGKG